MLSEVVRKLENKISKLIGTLDKIFWGGYFLETSVGEPIYVRLAPVEKLKESACEICEKPRVQYHSTTWGVSNTMLGCNIYFLCTNCTARAGTPVQRSTLSPCGEKHVKI
jgi:hypothetical protein